MEKCVDSDYPETQYDSSKSSKTWAETFSDKSKNSQESSQSKESVKISRARKKIAAENRSVGRWESGKNVANATSDKSFGEASKRGTKPNVLNSRLMSARLSVQNNTKILHRNVPDRIGKYVKSSARPETKLFLSRCSSIGIPSNDCSMGKVKKAVKHSNVTFPLKNYPETKLNMVDNECLRNKESVDLDDRNEPVSGTKNIFEKIFDDCLGSTRVVKDASSQEILNLEAGDGSVAINPETVEKYTRLLENFENFKKDDARMLGNEKTPLKKDRCQNPPGAPVKIKDHSSYFNHKKIRHVCGYCHKIFKSNGKLNSHVYSHTGERPFDCNHCGKAFSSKFKLVRHLLIHSEIRKFVCQICDRTFLRNDHLKNHYKIHDPQKKMYKCPKENCDKEYSSMMSHKKHMAYHSVEDGDLKCLLCGVKFETKEEILFHLKSHSGSRLFKSQSDKKFKCEFCERLFLTRKDVTRHLVVHTGERDFLCQFCPQRFGRKDHLVRHIKKSHANEGVSVKSEIKQLMDRREERKGADAAATGNTRGSAFSGAQQPTTCARQSAREGEAEEAADEADFAEEEANEKTHIVITVKNPVQKRKWKSSDANARKLSFRRSGSPVPNRKQGTVSKSKSSTTQIFIENIPNILIIPNNSIILLRNQSGSGNKVKKVTESNESNSSSNDNNNNNKNNLSNNNGDDNNNNNNNDDNNNNNGGNDNVDASTVSSIHPQINRFEYNEDFNMESRSLPNSDMGEEPGAALQTDCGFNMGYSYSSNAFQQPQFASCFPYNESFCSFQPEMMGFGHQLEALNMEMLMQSELLKREEASGGRAAESFASENGGLIEDESLKMDGIGQSPAPDMHRKIGVVKPIKNFGGHPCDVDKDLFDGTPDNLMMADSILNDFKVDDSVMLPLDADGGAQSNIFGQSGGESTGNELLRSLLLGENPILSPLPGFSQIFQNSNTN